MTSPATRLRLVIASGNPGKIAEIRELLAGSPVDCLGLSELPDGGMISEPAETGSSFEGNARIKATEYARRLKTWVLADDSGLVVDALGGAPGVDSAIWAGGHGTRAERDGRNNARLVRELSGVPHENRRARFVCVMCLADEVGSIRATTTGAMEGVIVDAPRGSGGFGYDPYFLQPDLGRTNAELTLEEKNRRSHRAQATRAMAALVARMLAQR